MKLYALFTVSGIVSLGLEVEKGGFLAPRALGSSNFGNDGFDFNADANVLNLDKEARGKNRGGSKAALKVNHKVPGVSFKISKKTL